MTCAWITPAALAVLLATAAQLYTGPGVYLAAKQIAKEIAE